MEGSSQRRDLEVSRLGRVPYDRAAALQDGLVARRRAGEIPDQLLLLEHPHVITLGSSSDPRHVLLDEVERRLLGIQLFESGRGGDVTYHGPGQLVGYPILDLRPDRKDVHRYIRDLEGALILTLEAFRIPAARRGGLTGVWVGDAKIAAIGVRVSSGWITSHGFALNIATDLQFFDAIIPCGIRNHGVTSMERVLGARVERREVEDRVVQGMAATFGRVPRPGRVAVEAAAPDEGPKDLRPPARGRHHPISYPGGGQDSREAGRSGGTPP
jgi:lipoyl(octanoyl) transferase